jgi:uncharacterized protein (DUF488 family)
MGLGFGFRGQSRELPMASHKLFTIGYEGASVEELVVALRAAGATRLIDVRYSPYSKRGAFSREALAPSVESYGIAYAHIRALGNPPAGREAARLGHRAVYREIFMGHLDGAEGQEGLRQALALAQAEPSCLMCLERAAKHCHRGMVAERLAALGNFEVEHLMVSKKAGHPGQATFDF